MTELVNIGIKRAVHKDLRTACAILPDQIIQDAATEAVSDWLSKKQPEIQAAAKQVGKSHGKRSSHNPTK